MKTECIPVSIEMLYEATLYLPVGNPIRIPLAGATIQEASESALALMERPGLMIVDYETSREFVDLKKVIRFTVALKPVPREQMKAETLYRADGKGATCYLHGASAVPSSER